MGENFRHLPVLPREVLEYLRPERGGLFIDCTLGGGGHSRLILEAAENVRLMGLDQDENARNAAAANLAEFGERFTACRMNFGDLAELQETGWDHVDGILMDIGVSSHQIDEAERGFSYMNDGPLDMRMDRRQELTAAKVLNESSEEELRRIGGFKERSTNRLSIIITGFTESVDSVGSSGVPVRQKLIMEVSWKVEGKGTSHATFGREVVTRTYPYSADVVTLDWNREAALRLLSEMAARGVLMRLGEQP